MRKIVPTSLIWNRSEIRTSQTFISGTLCFYWVILIFQATGNSCILNLLWAIHRRMFCEGSLLSVRWSRAFQCERPKLLSLKFRTNEEAPWLPNILSIFTLYHHSNCPKLFDHSYCCPVISLARGTVQMVRKSLNASAFASLSKKSSHLVKKS